MAADGGSDGVSTDGVASGRAWAELCDALKAAGDVILAAGNPADPLDRAEGFRMLSRLVRYGFESFLEFSDPLAPELVCSTHATIKMIHENPDNVYLGARIDGRHRYRVWGTRGTARWMSVNVHAGPFGAGGRGTAAALDARDLEIAADGTFELFLGGERCGANWMALPADATSLIVRQSLADRTRERPAELRIERLDAAGPPPPVDTGRIERGFQMTALLVRTIAEMATEWAGALARTPNRFAEVMPRAASIFRDPHIHFHAAYFQLAPDEALVVEARPPACDYWMFALHNHWLESLDYRYHRITLNDHTAQREPDGSVRVVVAHADPGHPNWLDTAGHARGTIGVRWVGADVRDVVPEARTVAVAEVRAWRRG
jgi:hypothetical protein